MQKQFLVLVLMFVAMSSSVWAECGKLCDENWWKTATAAEVQAELDAGANVNASNKFRNTPLHYAAKSDNAEGVQLLIAAGADITAKDGFGTSVWELAQSSPLQGSAAYWALNDARFK
jgi:hypothetical protein